MKFRFWDPGDRSDPLRSNCRTYRTVQESRCWIWKALSNERGYADGLRCECSVSWRILFSSNRRGEDMRGNWREFV